MAFALRCLFILVALGAIGFFLYMYRRKTNQIVVIVVGSYAALAGWRLFRIEQEPELIRNSLLALVGLIVVWGGVWLTTRWLERRGGFDGD